MCWSPGERPVSDAASRCAVLVMGADVTILDLGEKSAEHVLDEAA